MEILIYLSCCMLKSYNYYIQLLFLLNQINLSYTILTLYSVRVSSLNGCPLSLRCRWLPRAHTSQPAATSVPPPQTLPTSDKPSTKSSSHLGNLIMIERFGRTHGDSLSLPYLFINPPHTCALELLHTCELILLLPAY